MGSPSHAEILALLPAERDALIGLLGDLGPAGWSAVTACPGWTVHDIAAHLLGDDLGVLSAERDGYREGPTAPPTWTGLVDFVNARNEAWVDAWRRASPRLLTEALAWSGPLLWRHFADLDPEELGPPISWAGEAPAPHRLRVAREYTERWVHQQQIRDAIRKPGLREERWVRPLLDTFAFALPVALGSTVAPAGTRISLVAVGEGGARWDVVRRSGRWELDDERAPAAASLTIDVETAWRLYTRQVDRATAEAQATFGGEAALARRLLGVVAIIA